MSIRIGVFDSGIGGLTVAKQIKAQIASAQIIYFGDTLHLPYGDKSKEAIVSYCIKIGEFLASKKCDCIVIACNTASAYAYKKLEKHLDIPIVNVIDPIAEYVASHFSNQTIGVIATKGTIQSRVYPRKIKALNKALTVKSLATPLLAPMIEEGYYNNNISKTIIHAYLSKKELKDIQAIVLGCTHYPLIEQTIKSYYKQRVQVINSALIVAKYIQKKFANKSKISRKNLKDQFFVSDFTTSFQQSAAQFFTEEIALKKKNIWLD